MDLTPLSTEELIKELFIRIDSGVFACNLGEDPNVPTVYHKVQGDPYTNRDLAAFLMQRCETIMERIHDARITEDGEEDYDEDEEDDDSSWKNTKA